MTLLYLLQQQPHPPQKRVASLPSDSSSAPSLVRRKRAGVLGFKLMWVKGGTTLECKKEQRLMEVLRQQGCSRGKGTVFPAFTPLGSSGATENSASVANFLGVSWMSWRGFIL